MFTVFLGANFRWHEKDFLKVATKRERAEVATACNDSVPYLYQIAGRHRYASPLLAMRIEKNTRIVAASSNGRLKPVSRTTQVRHPEIFFGIGETAIEKVIKEMKGNDGTEIIQGQ